MLELLVSFLMMFGVTFSMTESGQVKVIGDAEPAKKEVRESKDFEMLGGEPALNAIIIHDGTDGKE